MENKNCVISEENHNINDILKICNSYIDNCRNTMNYINEKYNNRNELMKIFNNYDNVKNYNGNFYESDIPCNSPDSEDNIVCSINAGNYNYFMIIQTLYVSLYDLKENNNNIDKNNSNINTNVINFFTFMNTNNIFNKYISKFSKDDIKKYKKIVTSIDVNLFNGYIWSINQNVVSSYKSFKIFTSNFELFESLLDLLKKVLI